MLYIVDRRGICTSDAESVLYVTCDAFRRTVVRCVTVGQVVWC